MVRWVLPRFDVKADTPLNDLMKELGVKAAFDAQAADFQPLTATPAFLSSVRQAARVKIDEEGVEAAAFTEMAVCTSSLPMGEVEMTLDRPFLFAIYDANGLPLFVGTVQIPQ
jgi:serpin B